MKILLIGAGVIGTVYGSHLCAAGADVTVLAHGRRTDQVAEYGLIARDLASGSETRANVEVVSQGGRPCDLVLVSVRREQIWSTLQALGPLPAQTPLLVFGNNPTGRSGLSGLSNPVFLGFPGVGGKMVDGVAEYALVRQQPTALEGSPEWPLIELQRLLETRGFVVQRVHQMEGWLTYHAVFIASITTALYRCGTDPVQLSRDRSTLNLMCRAITEGFAELRTKGVPGAPGNLTLLHRRLLHPFAVNYWARKLRSPVGETHFAAHAREARVEMQTLTEDVLSRIGSGASAPSLRLLLGARNTG
jgi:2-dehydropantoate 2-reductase